MYFPPFSLGVCIHAIPHTVSKSHRFLAPLDPISHKIFKSHRICIPFHKLFFDELEINHTLAWLAKAYFIKIMAFNLCKFESDFHKNLTEFHQVSPKNLQNLTDLTANGMYGCGGWSVLGWGRVAKGNVAYISNIREILSEMLFMQIL